MAKIAVLGAGGVGGYFGARLAAGGAEVHFLARGPHLEALQQRGLRLKSPLGDLSLQVPATEDPRKIGPVDLVLFCVKSTDTESAARKLTSLLRPDTPVISLQNGVDNEAKIDAVAGAGHAVGGVAYIMATIGEPGVIVHEGPMARLVVGELDGEPSERLERFAALCASSGIEAQLAEDIRVDLWHKMAFICAVAGMTAAVRLPVGDIRASEPALELLERLARETARVARHQGVPLAESTPETIVDTVRRLPADNFSSLHYDLTHGKPMELEALHGTVLRLARAADLEVPASESVYAILHPWALRNR